MYVHIPIPIMALTCLVAASDDLFRDTFENNFDRNLLGIKGTPYSFMGHELSWESLLDTSVFSDALVTKHAKCFCWQERNLSLWSLANPRHLFISRNAIFLLSFYTYILKLQTVLQICIFALNNFFCKKHRIMK